MLQVQYLKVALIYCYAFCSRLCYCVQLVTDAVLKNPFNSKLKTLKLENAFIGTHKEVGLKNFLEKDLLAKRLRITKPKSAKQLLQCVPYLRKVVLS